MLEEKLVVKYTTEDYAKAFELIDSGEIKTLPIEERIPWYDVKAEGVEVGFKPAHKYFVESMYYYGEANQDLIDFMIRNKGNKIHIIHDCDMIVASNYQKIISDYISYVHNVMGESRQTFYDLDDLNFYGMD